MQNQKQTQSQIKASGKKRAFIKRSQKGAIILPFLMPMQVHAQGEGFPLLEGSEGVELLPPEITELLIQLIVACGVIGVAFAIICLMIAGGYRMVGQTDKARLWSVDIIKGLGQVLLAPVIIFLLVTITGLIFKNVPGLGLFF